MRLFIGTENVPSKPQDPGSKADGPRPDSAKDAWEFLLDSYYPSRRRRLRRFFRTVASVVLGLVVVCAAIAGFLEFGMPAYHGTRLWWLESSRLEPEEVRDEIDFLRKAVYEGHPRPFEFASRAEMDGLFAEIAAMEEPISRWELFRRVAPVIARLGCGHTSLIPGSRYVRAFIGGGSVLPLRGVIINGRLYVSQAYDESAMPLLGQEILSINDFEAHEIIDRLVGSQSRDGFNPALAVYEVNDLFPFHYHLLMERARKFLIRARSEVGVREYRLSAVPTRQVLDEYRRQNPRRNYFHVRSRLEPVVLAESDAAYLGIPSFQGFGRNREAMEQFFESIDRQGISHLVIDLRGNTGGDPILATLLLRYLLSEPFHYLDDSNEAVEKFTDFGFERYDQQIAPFRESGYRGDLYVLIDGGSFSQTGQVASMLKVAGIAVFIGQESGGSFSCNDSSTMIEMPHSGFRLKLARTGFETTAQSLPRGRGIIPDVVIQSSIEDLLSGRDPVLEWVDEHLGTDLQLRVGGGSA
jgi:hypothetical protein